MFEFSFKVISPGYDHHGSFIMNQIKSNHRLAAIGAVYNWAFDYSLTQNFGEIERN